MKNLLETSTLLCMTFAILLPACGGDDANDDEVGETAGDGDTTTGDGDTTTGDGDTTTGDGDTTTDDTTETTETTGGEMGMIRLVHLGVFPNDENTAVDIFANGAPTGVTFEFKQGTPYVELPAGTYTFDVVPSGGTIDDSVFTVADFPLGAGEVWSAYAAGYVAPEGPDDAPFSVAAFQDDIDTIPAGNIRLNVVHAGALGALNPVDVWVVDDACEPVDPLLVDFAYGDIAANLDLPAGAINVGFDVGQDATVDACFSVPDLGGDLLVDAYAVNDSQGNVSIVAHLPDGTIAELLPN
ncbi:DUF4397 domain-containing protein [Nannocystaceae bacterium ST9]